MPRNSTPTRSTGPRGNSRTAARERLRAEREQEARRGRLRRRFVVAGSAVAALALAAGIGVAVGNGGGSTAKDRAAARQPLKVPAAAASSQDGTVITYGDKNAKNTLTVYEDPRCPYCAMFEQADGATVKKLADEGRFKVEYHMATFLDDALGGKGSKRALNALGAAAQEGPARFLALHEVLYGNHPDEHDDAFANTGHLLALAGKVPGLRTPAFDKAVRDLTYMPWVEKVSRSFDHSGVQGTPTVLLNGRKLPVINDKGVPVTGPQFTTMIDKQLTTK
jgi:protein-disulfide isomerase